MVNIRKAYTFDDFLLEPMYSECMSRKELDISTNLTKNIKLKMPLISSNMDTITESKMAIEFSLLGGIGILHRYLSIDEQVAMVKAVKRHMNYVITHPYTINISATVNDYKNLVREKGVDSFLVVQDNTNLLLGIVNSRDTMFFGDNSLIQEVMTPFDKLHYMTIENDEDTSKISMHDVYEIMKQHKVEKLPIIYKNQQIAGMVTLKDLKHYKEVNKVATVDKNGRLRVGAAVGVQQSDHERIDRLVEAGVDILCIDVAHGHHILVKNILKYIKSKYNIDVIAGNVATADGVKFLAENGADAIKVNIGAGSICVTRQVAGAGIPMLTALWDCVTEATKYGIPIISDGGNGGVIASIPKALAAGASTVMLGGMISGTDETPGPILMKDNKRVKIIRGMAGYGANISRRQKLDNKETVEDLVPEGIEAVVEYKGSVKEVLYQICGGIRSSMSYLGVSKIEDMQEKARWVKISSASRRESNYHSVTKI